jgi:hypothetical protein
MLNRRRIRPSDLIVGSHYLHVNQLFIRQIDSIEGDTVTYHDQYGEGHCSKRAFVKTCPLVASPEDMTLAEEQLKAITRTTSGCEFSVRDEANALTAYAFRNGLLEDLHAGKPLPTSHQRGYSRISDDEMRRLMIEASAKLSSMLGLKQEDPAKYETVIRDYQRRYCRSWNRD